MESKQAHTFFCGVLSMFCLLCLLYHNRGIYSRKPLILQRIPAVFQAISKKKQGISCFFSSAYPLPKSYSIVTYAFKNLPSCFLATFKFFTFGASLSRTFCSSSGRSYDIFIFITFFLLFRRAFRLYFTKQNASANRKLINNDAFRNSHVILSFIPIPPRVSRFATPLIPPRVSHFVTSRTIAAVSGSV